MLAREKDVGGNGSEIGVVTVEDGGRSPDKPPSPIAPDELSFLSSLTTGLTGIAGFPTELEGVAADAATDGTVTGVCQGLPLAEGLSDGDAEENIALAWPPLPMAPPEAGLAPCLPKAAVVAVMEDSGAILTRSWCCGGCGGCVSDEEVLPLLPLLDLLSSASAENGEAFVSGLGTASKLLSFFNERSKVGCCCRLRTCRGGGEENSGSILDILLLRGAVADKSIPAVGCSEERPPVAEAVGRDFPPRSCNLFSSARGSV